MRAVWRAARAAVRRRRLQTVVIAVMVAVSTALLTFAAGLLAASTAPFDNAFKARHGAHLAVTFEAGKFTADQAGATAKRPGVSAASGPFAVVTLPTSAVFGDLTVVARPGPDAPVDDLKLNDGRWAANPGEIVVSGRNFRRPAPYTIKTKAGGTLTVVGSATSVTDTSTAWAPPAVVATLGKPAGWQMLYRFESAATPAKLRGSFEAAAGPIPGDALLGSTSWLDIRNDYRKNPQTVLPIISLFGILGLLTAVLIIANVVSGAVVSGFRHIGVLKALGFSPAQVTGVYVTMVAVPAVVGCLVGVAAGNLLAVGLLSQVEEALDMPSVAGLGLTLDLVAIAVVLGVVVATALVPAARAGRLPAARAIAAHATATDGRARRAQTWLSGLSLPRPVTLGLALPLARPGRAALTVAAVAFGVMSVTFAAGLEGSIRNLRDVQVQDPTIVDAVVEPSAPALTGRIEEVIRTQPGTARVSRAGRMKATVTGLTDTFDLEGYQAEGGAGRVMLRGRWLAGPGEAVVSGTFLKDRERRIGDSLTLRLRDRTATVRIVGSVFDTESETMLTRFETLSALDPALRPDRYIVDLVPGTDVMKHSEGMARALEDDPMLSGKFREIGMRTSAGDSEVIFTVLFGTLALLISLACALGVLNTVVLNTRERSRDLGVLKAVGMSPPQVIGMMIVSMSVIGLIGGLLGVPAGVGLHRIALLATERSIASLLPTVMFDPYAISLLVALPVAGVVIAALGALLPAGWAARIKTAAVLRGE